MGHVDSLGSLADAAPAERLEEIEARRSDLEQMRTQVDRLQSEADKALAITSRMVEAIVCR